MTATDVRDATDAIFACLEVSDSRFTTYPHRTVDDVADNSSAARVRCGPAIPLEHAGSPREVVVERDGASTVAPAAGLELAAEAVARLVNEPAPEPWALDPGTVVLCGGLAEPFLLRSQQRIAARLGGVGGARMETVGVPSTGTAVRA